MSLRRDFGLWNKFENIIDYGDIGSWNECIFALWRSHKQWGSENGMWQFEKCPPKEWYYWEVWLCWNRYGLVEGSVSLWRWALRSLLLKLHSVWQTISCYLQDVWKWKYKRNKNPIYKLLFWLQRHTIINQMSCRAQCHSSVIPELEKERQQDLQYPVCLHGSILPVMMVMDWTSEAVSKPPQLNVS